MDFIDLTIAALIQLNLVLSASNPSLRGGSRKALLLF